MTDDPGQLTMTVVVPAGDAQPSTVALTEYVPAAAAVASGIVGFCSAEVNPFGPVQEYVAPGTVEAVSVIVAPSGYGPPLPAVGASGVDLTVTSVVAAAVVQLPAVAVTLYVPVADAVTLPIVGF